MTEKEFLELPRRKADALVAETVLGCQVRWHERKRNGKGLGHFDPWLVWSNGRFRKCPGYTWSMTDCWPLVPEMARRDLYIVISPEIDRTYKVVVYDGAGNKEGEASHKEPVYAVCIALLRALGVIVKAQVA